MSFRKEPAGSSSPNGTGFAAWPSERRRGGAQGEIRQGARPVFSGSGVFLRGLSVDRFIVDGELVVEIEGHLSFDALQMRLHPAESRVRKLSNETPARLVLFDMLVSPNGTSLLDLPLARRREALETFGKRSPFLAGSSSRLRRRSLAGRRWLSDSGKARRTASSPNDGTGPMSWTSLDDQGEALGTADCVVGGFRYQSRGREVGSLAARPL